MASVLTGRGPARAAMTPPDPQPRLQRKRAWAGARAPAFPAGVTGRLRTRQLRRRSMITEYVGQLARIQDALAPRVEPAAVRTADAGFDLRRRRAEAPRELAQKDVGLALGNALGNALGPALGEP